MLMDTSSSMFEQATCGWVEFFGQRLCSHFELEQASDESAERTPVIYQCGKGWPWKTISASVKVTCVSPKRSPHSLMQDFPFVQNLDLRMNSAKEKLQFRLLAALKAALVNKQGSARQHCFLAYAAISDAAGAEKVTSQFRALLLMPLFGTLSLLSPGGLPRTVRSNATGHF